MGQFLPELSTDRLEALVNFIDKSVDDAYNLSLGFGRVRWTPSRTKEGVSIQRARGGPDDAILEAAVRGSCNVSATFGELSDLLITETTADFADHENAVNPSEFHDGQVVYTLVPRTAQDRFACVKWHCVKSQAPSVARHRDFVYVELVDSFRDADGRRVGYRLSKSVDLDIVSPRDTFVRAKTLTLQTWSERAPGSLELVTMMINDLGDRLPAWLMHKMVDTAAMRSACIRDHINQRRLDFGNATTQPRKQVPNMFHFRPMSSSMGKSERLSKASTSPSSPGDEEGRLDVEEIQPQILGDNILAPAPVELDLGVGKYKETFTQQPTQAERDYEAEAAELAEYSDSEEEEVADDDAGNFLNTGGPHMEVVRQSLSQATVVTLDMDAPTVHKVEVASFLTEEENANLDAVSDDSDSASFLTLDENSKVVESASFGRSSESMPVPVQVEEFVVEEVAPENVRTVPRRSMESSLEEEELVVEEVHPESGDIVPRHSIEMEEFVVEDIQPENVNTVSRLSIEIEAEEMEVPMVVRKIAKRMVVGSGGRRSRERPPAPRPSGAPPPPPNVKAVLTDSMSSAKSNKPQSTPNGSRTAPPPTPTPAPAPEEETIKLEDLQVHLDRMNKISANLRDLRNEMKVTTEAPASTQSAMAALATFETKANAERAAKIAANFISLLDRQAAPAARRAQQYLKRGGPRSSLFNLSLAMGDGSFVDYLPDSTFEEVGESPDGTGFGWQSVVSNTTGKQYFFNQNCALASWTLPGPDVFRGTLYIVL
ncbi:hypothetical protein BBO99_00007760 [Phytophthora kernoviae]|uniref:WW domain-containing protein n=2 Tax=Phytophthora kernoviae TaxID=325452 RepID=A0A3R7GV12_9STRA|nr:hypothetical protein G195_006178 [Phytophthora kernoviae 00238/432]KAG2518199.1 hypothetical protein JM16_005401 [Phytophthora kernoviae]KAG2520036.1 hypothetical protein JM18_007350 [Phytophthora kernoviae]RLN32516.1 hypothetical protein BBI17_007686 [Phytophthora kernoviae]RLN76157.1 hypothetical protein BBO99_00007760 [Phytophthora kernoviae]